MHTEMAELYPICRSITGDGVRQSLTLVARRLDVQQHEVPSGTAVFDWQVPDEWNIRDAYIKDPGRRKIADFIVCNLHVLQYSTPVHERMSLEQFEQSPARLDRIRRANVTNCLRKHDWSHRWRRVLDLAGLAPMPAYHKR